MNTKEFITALSARLNVSRNEATDLLQVTTRVMRETLAADKNLSLQRLGNFKVKTLKSRTAYIPALGKKAIVPPRDVVQFNPASGLKNKLKNTPLP